jgi:hypothetical protein
MDGDEKKFMHRERGWSNTGQYRIKKSRPKKKRSHLEAYHSVVSNTIHMEMTANSSADHQHYPLIMCEGIGQYC